MRFGWYTDARCRMRIRTSFFVGPLAAGIALLCQVSAQEVPYRLELADKIRMIESGDGSERPFFRVQFNVVNENGVPVSIAPPKDPTAVFDVAESDGRLHRPLLLHYSQETLKQVPSDVPDQRYALLLIDISGSMLDSSGAASETVSNKYEAAKTAAGKFLGGFQPGQDHVAVVAFESHQVRERVKRGRFCRRYRIRRATSRRICLYLRNITIRDSTRPSIRRWMFLPTSSGRIRLPGRCWSF